MWLCCGIKCFTFHILKLKFHMWILSLSYFTSISHACDELFPFHSNFTFMWNMFFYARNFSRGSHVSLFHIINFTFCISLPVHMVFHMLLPSSGSVVFYLIFLDFMNDQFLCSYIVFRSFCSVAFTLLYPWLAKLVIIKFSWPLNSYFQFLPVGSSIKIATCFNLWYCKMVYGSTQLTYHCYSKNSSVGLLRAIKMWTKLCLMRPKKMRSTKKDNDHKEFIPPESHGIHEDICSNNRRKVLTDKMK